MTHFINITEIRAIAEHVRSIDPDDDQLLADMIEAETDAAELLDMLIEREAVCESHIEANKARIKMLQERNARFEASSQAGRSAMARILDAAGVRKMERPEATISLRATAPKVIGDDVDALPDDCFVTKRQPVKAEIKRALESGSVIPGWSLSNGGEAVSVRRK